MFRQFIFACCFAISMVFCSVAAFAGKVELTTYYPSPFGEYTDLETQALHFKETGSDPEGLIAFNYADSDYDGRLRITAGEATTNNDQSASIDLHGLGRGTNAGRLDLVAGRNSEITFWASITGSDPEEKMRLTSAGNFGIGESDPGEKLAVLGAVAIGSTTAWSQATTIGNGNLSVEGAVGIGVKAPVNQLDVEGAAVIGAGYSGTSAAQANGLLVQGKVGIGTTAPGTYMLYVNGTGYLNAAAWTYGSDKRLKENISNIPSGLNVVEQLKPVKFDYIKGDKKQAGFIAQEVQEVLPDIVTEGADGMLGMKTDSIIPYLVKAVQEQQKEIEDLKRTVAELQKQKAAV